MKLPRTTALLAGCLAAVALLAAAPVASAKTYHPTRTDDPRPNGCKPRDCSLREALIANENLPRESCRFRWPSLKGCTTVVLRPGRRYVLTRRGSGKDSLHVGDLDLVQTQRAVAYFVVKTAKGGKPATIDANGIDRIFDARGSNGLTLNRVVLRDGHARASSDGGYGGAILGGNVNLRDSRLVNNVADGNGGGISVSGGGLRITRSRLKGNAARDDGGALYMDGQADRLLATVTKTRATHNRAGGAGGMAALTNEGGISLSRSYVADNRAAGAGGGIYSTQGNAVSTDVAIDRSTITGNESGSNGGGLYTTYTVVTNSTISANRAAINGGGIAAWVGDPGSIRLSVENSTIANNEAGSSGGGIAALSGFATGRLVAVTIARNVAGQGGGLYQGDGDLLTVINTIVALNRVGSGAGGSDCFTASGGIDSQGHNLIGDSSGCGGFTAVGDLVGGALELGKLADNGGPTRTVSLQRGSRAIGGADPSALPPEVVRVDQRGIRRDKMPDIGAFERIVKKKKGKKKK